MVVDPAETGIRVEVRAPAMTTEVEALLERLSREGPETLPGFRDGTAVLLAPPDILRFYGEDKAVLAQTADGVYTVRQRLYELEGKLDRHTFVRISHSEIVNLRKITAMDLAITGTIRITLAEETVCYVSRRYVKKIKEALEL